MQNTFHRAITGKRLQACGPGISMKEMIIIMLDIMWRRVTSTYNIRGSKEKKATRGRLPNTDLALDRKSKRQQPAYIRKMEQSSVDEQERGLP